MNRINKGEAIPKDYPSDILLSYKGRVEKRYLFHKEKGVILLNNIFGWSIECEPQYKEYGFKYGRHMNNLDIGEWIMPILLEYKTYLDKELTVEVDIRKIINGHNVVKDKFGKYFITKDIYYGK